MANLNILFRRAVPLIKPLLSPLALSFTVIFLTVLAFGHLADEVREGETLRFDTTLLLVLNHHATSGLNTFFLIVTDLGDKFFVASLAALLIAIAVWRRALSTAIFITLSIGGAALLNLVLKLIFQRQRPDLWQQIITETSFSFPSGHAMASAALAVCVVALAWQSRWRWPALVIGGMYVALVGISRLYLGVHYPTDVIGGWLVSLTWVLSVALLWRRQLSRKAIKLTIK